MAEAVITKPKRVSVKHTCSICLENFIQPKLLPCFHTFCLTCLEEYIPRAQKDNRFDCPLCRKPVEIPAGGVERFQTNIYIEGLHDCAERGEEIFCDVCGHRKQAEHRCIECEENFCSVCTTAHTKMKATREHRLIAVASCEGESRKIKSKSFCTQHVGEEIKMVCRSCDELLCIVCKLTRHENHTTVDTAQEAGLKREELTGKVHEVEGHLKSLATTLSEVEELSGQLMQQLDEDVKSVDEHTKKLIMKINMDAEEMKTTMRKSYRSQFQSYLKVKEDVEAQTKTYRELITSVQSILQSAEDHGLLMFSKDLKDALSADRVTIQPAVIDAVLRFERSELKTNMYSLGELKGVNQHQKNEVTVSETGSLMYSPSCSSKEAIAMTCSELYVFVSFLDTIVISQYSLQPGNKRIDLCRINSAGDCDGLVTNNKDICYFTNKSDKTVNMCDILSCKQETLHTVDMFPHGIAYRSDPFSTCKELIVCLLADKILMSRKASKGRVVAIPISSPHKQYDILITHTPAPVCIAVDQETGRICLGYPAEKKVRLISPEGLPVAEFGGNDMVKDICPVSVCFDYFGGLIVADYNNGRVLRLDKHNANFLQVLVNEKNQVPMSLAIEEGNVLWVGFMSKNITKYQMEYQE